MTNSKPANHVDVAIVGGGVAGTYCAWLLGVKKQQEAAQKRLGNVHLFEMSDRIGGRLLSVPVPGFSDTCVELGGMRYSSKHRLVNKLVGELDLAPTRFQAVQRQNIAYLRGRVLRRRDLSYPDSIPYGLLPDERAVSVLKDEWRGLIRRAAERIWQYVLEEKRDLTKEIDWNDWNRLANAKYGPYLLEDLPLRALLQRHISAEALRFAEDASGYNSMLTTWNGFDGLRWNVAGLAEQKYFRVEQGFQRLPVMMHDAFREPIGKNAARVHMKHTLKTVSLSEEGDEPLIRMEFAAGPKVYFARHLILAMPRHALEQLAIPVPRFESVWEAIETVTPIPLFKLALCYPFPWWETIEAEGARRNRLRPIRKGQSVTDLPVRQCYYWKVDPETQNAVVLLYDDGRDRDYWEGLLEEGLLNPDHTGGGVAGEFSTFPKGASLPALVIEAHRQLVEMHGVGNRLDIPEPHAAAYQDWKKAPYGGGANFWHLQVSSGEVSKKMIRPIAGVNIYVCGEAYSRDHQGWVEGALETAEKVVECVLSGSPPNPPAASA